MARQNGNVTELVVHARFAGKSFDVPLSLLGVGPAWADEYIKRALAQHLEVAESALRDYVVDRHPNGNLTVRPSAVFG